MRRQTSLLLSALALTAAMGACSVEKTEEGKAPDVDVNAEGAKLPEYNVEAADVNVTTDTQQVVTPEINVTPPSGGQ